MTAPKLTLELVPKTCWFSNVRNHVAPLEWSTIKRETAASAHHRCEVCGGRGEAWPVECHEVFSFDDKNKVQRLDGMQALCPACHRVKHFGLAEIMGKREEALARLCEVNGWTSEEGERYVEEAFDLWRWRSRHEWDVDLSYLKRRFGIRVLEEGKGTRSRRALSFADQQARSGGFVASR